MKSNYRLELRGNEFILIDHEGENTGACATEQTAWETAKNLIDVAIKVHMQMHDVDRETSKRLLRDAAEVTD